MSNSKTIKAVKLITRFISFTGVNYGLDDVEFGEELIFIIGELLLLYTDSRGTIISPELLKNGRDIETNKAFIREFQNVIILMLNQTFLMGSLGYPLKKIAGTNVNVFLSSLLVAPVISQF